MHKGCVLQGNTTVPLSPDSPEHPREPAVEAGSERQAQEGYCAVGIETPAATCCSQEPAHTLDVSSACGITAGTGKEEAAGLQWDCRPGVCNGMCLWCCQLLSPRSSVPLEQRIIAKADKQPWANTAICSSSLTPSKSNMTFPVPLSLPGGTDPPKAQQAQPCSQPFPLPAAASARSQHQTPLQ